MVKRTLYFGNPAYLRLANEQLVIELPDTKETKSAPIEDLGVVILDHQQVTISTGAMAKLLEHNVALVTCDMKTHHPVGLFLNLNGHTLQSAKFKAQIDASLPLKKQLWQQTIVAKISNQAQMLAIRQADYKTLVNYAREVKSGDSEGHEAKAAAYYWKRVFPMDPGFRRDRYGPAPNHLLNYGYAILRAIVARSLVGSGLMPTLGIFHRNQYNAYCLADDIMEPYRPFVDRAVCRVVDEHGLYPDLTPEFKRTMLSVPQLDVKLDDCLHPLMTAVQRTTASLARCFEGEEKRIVYPQMI